MSAERLDPARPDQDGSGAQPVRRENAAAPQNESRRAHGFVYFCRVCRAGMISAGGGRAPDRLKWPRVPNTIVYGNEKRHGDGRVELIDRQPDRGIAALQRGSRSGPGRAPQRGPPTTTRRSGSAWRTAFPTYMLASGLMTSGMNWWQALLTILLGNTIVLIPILLNSHPGHAVRHPLPGLRARVVRDARLEPAGAHARARRVRLVRHPVPGSAARR